LANPERVNKAALAVPVIDENRIRGSIGAGKDRHAACHIALHYVCAAGHAAD
jgi:hypothetical protein